MGTKMEHAVNVWRWNGGEERRPWGKLSRDPEIWNPKGDTLIYLGRDYREAAFRVDSSILHNTGSDVFNRVLLEGCRPSKVASVLTSKVGAFGTAASAIKSDPDVSNLSSNLDQHASKEAAASVSTISSSSTTTSSNSGTGIEGIAGIEEGSRDKSGILSAALPHNPPHELENDATIKFDISFPATGLDGPAALQFHLTTRNVLALLLEKSLVGLNFGLTVKHLLKRLQAYLPPETNCADMIVRYIVSNKILDSVCDNPSMAAGILAKYEDQTVEPTSTDSLDENKKPKKDISGPLLAWIIINCR